MPLFDHILTKHTHKIPVGVFIGSIFYEVTEQQLRDAFSPFGPIKVVNLNLDPMTGKHKGFAFIWFDIPEAAQLAIEGVRKIVKMHFRKI